VAEATAAPMVAGEASVAPAVTRPRLETDKLSAMYGKFTAVKNVSLAFAPNRVHALIGPSGCGKSTFLRTLNRMHEMSEGGWITGRVLLDGEDVYASRVSAMQLRKRVGMVFQRPTPFPTMTIYENVAAGLKVSGRVKQAELRQTVERALEQAGLCIARTIAPAPEVVLLDEPTSALDPQGTQRIEELLYQLKREFTIVIVTHNMQQAARVSDTTSFFYMGTLVESGATRQIFTAPREEQTEAYITGRFG